MTLLRIQNLCAGYGGGTVLRDISLTAMGGTIHTILGPNGAGKTTLLQTIEGLHPATSGTIHVRGRDVTTMATYRRARLGIRIVPQPVRLFANLTVGEHLDLAATGPDRATAIAATLHRLPGLAARLRHRPDQLSGGEAQMLALARALLGRPTLLLLDEPTDGLAPAITATITDLLVEAAGGGTAVVITASRATDVHPDSDRVTVLRHGRIDINPPPDPVLLRRRRVPDNTSRWTDLLNPDPA